MFGCCCCSSKRSRHGAVAEEREECEGETRARVLDRTEWCEKRWREEKRRAKECASLCKDGGERGLRLRLGQIMFEDEIGRAHV